MSQVSKAEERSHMFVTIDGELSGDYIEAVETCCDQAKSIGKPVQLFLGDVSPIDQAGRALLCRLAAKGVRLLASGIYISHILQAPTPPRTETADSVSVAGRSDPTGNEA